MTSERSPWKKLLWPACIVLVIAAAVAERSGGVALKSCMLHDEVIALMSAACHQGDYERARLDLANHWVPAAAWKALLTTPRVACFGLIRSDLVQYDIHPPLFFWLMHVTGNLVGFGATTGPKLNVVVHAFALLALMVLTRTLTGSRLAAIGAAVLWSFSEVAFETTFMARQYELLGCLGVAAILSMHRLLTTETHPRRYAAALAVALGCMTVTQWFGLIGSLFTALLVVALGGIELFCRRRGTTPPLAATRFRELAAAWVGAQVLTFVLHPRIIQHYRQASHERFGEVERLGVSIRMRTTLQTLGGLFGIEHLERPSLAAFVIGALLLATVLVPCWQLVRALRTPAGPACSRALADACAAFAIPFFAAVVTIPYILGLGSSHSMSARYLSLLWPLWALGLVWPLAAAILHVRNTSLRASGGVALLLAFTVWPVWHGHAAKKASRPLCDGETNVSRALPVVTAVITDNTHRGTFGPSIPFIRDDALVFALPPPKDAVPERPDPPPLDKKELVKGLAQVDVVSIFHHPGGEITPRAAEDIRGAIDAVGLELMRMNEWVLALPRFVLLVAYHPPKHGAPPSDVVGWLQKRGATLTDADDLHGYAAVLQDGKIQKEVIVKEGVARLGSADLPAAPPVAFSIISSHRGSRITVGSVTEEIKRPGFSVVVYDPAARDVVYRALFQPGNPRQRPWSDVAARTTPR